MSKNKKQKARREAKDNHRKKAQQTIPVAANKPLAAPRPTKSPVSKLYSSSKTNPNAKPKSHPKTVPPAQLKAAPAPLPKKEPAQEKVKVQAGQKHEVPFGVYDRILLVGEGDFSFAHSLCMEHGCANVTATSFDSAEDVGTKYPQFEKIKTELEDLTPPVPILHDIDATKLPTYKTLRHVNEDGETEPWDTIAFQFPHTGGLSTDVNRQVRANQALLVGFFGSCLEVKGDKKDVQPARKKTKGIPFLRPGGKVVVTLFEGAPYSLWNVRDLARHAGLKVVESFKFSFKDYPGYSHVRTLGTIEGGGGWKGEEREARMYIFEKVETKGDVGSQGNVSESGRDARGMKMDPGRRKRRDGDGLKRGRESDEDEDDD